MHAQHNEWRETEGSIFEAHTLRRFNVIRHPPRAGCRHPCSNLRRRCSITGPVGTKPHPGRWRCNYVSLREKILYLEHFISQLHQGIQHCTQETHRVPGSRNAVVGNWGSQLQWKVSSSSSGNSIIIVVVAGILVGCLRSNRVPASSSHTSWANQVVAYYTSVGKLAGVEYQCLVLGHTRHQAVRHNRAQTTSWANQQVWASTTPGKGQQTHHVVAIKE